MFQSFLGLLLFISGTLSLTLTSVLQTDKGSIQGILQRIDDQNNVELYLGIRYANTQRFRRARDIDPWEGVYNATHPRFVCPQPEYLLSDTLSTEVVEDTIQALYSNEDCLFLNVWRPVNASASPRPILVWLYDDDYISGTIFSDQFDGRYLSFYGDVIVISVQYRLNAFGFLNGDDSREPGNLATYDQITALKWIQTNAASFGGDRSQITIFGGTPVGLLLMAKEANGLFQRAILQSGPVFGPLGMDTERQALEKTRTIGALLNCTDKKFEQVVNCLKAVPAENLVNATESLAHIGMIMKPFYDDDHIFEQSPVDNILSFNYNQRVDLLYGVNANESSPGIYSLFPHFAPDLNETIQVEDVFNAIRWIMQIGQVPYLDEVLQKYTQNLSDSSSQEHLRHIVSGLHSDINFVCPTMLFGQQIARNTPGRQYFSYYLADSVPMANSECADWMGVCYQQEISHIFGHSFIKWPAADTEIELSRALIEAWTRFARTGSPGPFNGTVDWTPAWDGRNFNTMILETDNSRMQNNLFQDFCDDFWRNKMFNLYRYGDSDD